MRTFSFSLQRNAVQALLFVVVLGSGAAVAQQEKILYSFNGVAGAAPASPSGLVMDKAGNLYGTTYMGGLYRNGSVFELLPQARGGWIERDLHYFNYYSDGSDGYYPRASLILDASGNLYGTTTVGGTYGWGTVFELTPEADGSWSEQILHNFSKSKTDGGYPFAALVFDSAGNLYGTTPDGGSGGGPGCVGSLGCGTVFELSPNQQGGWSETILHNFTNVGGDGANPNANLVFDAKGNLYGTTFNGGAYQYGTVFELSPTASGAWRETILHTFTGIDGGNPAAGVIFDSAGNLYSTAVYGGRNRSGTVFELSPSGGKTWTETVLQNFVFGSSGGSNPVTGVVFDPSGNLYGSTGYAVFELLPSAGIWTERVLATSDTTLGGFNAVILDERGNLYGTAGGGANNDGAVFELTR